MAQTLTADDLAAIWSYASRTLTQAAAQISSGLSGSTITIVRGDSLSLSVTGLGAITGFTELWFTAKDRKSDSDSQSKIMITSGSNLKYVNGQAPSSSDNGSISVSSCVLGNLTVTMSACETSSLLSKSLYYDFQYKSSSGSIVTLSSGILNVSDDVTRAVI